MNAERFMDLMNTLPDDMIVTAVHAEYHSRPKVIRLLPAIAAGIVLLISAAVYPKLRMQMPEVTGPPEMTAETTVAVTTASEQTMQITTQISAKSVTENAQTTAAVSATVYTTANTESAKAKDPETDMQTVTEPEQTEQPAVTERTSESSGPEMTVTTEPYQVTIPLWKGNVIGLIYEEEPVFNCTFQLFSTVQPDPFFGLTNPYNLLREEFAIPQEFDPEKNPCMEISVTTAYKNTAVTGCRYTQNGLTLTVAYLENGGLSNQIIRYAIPIPDNLTILPENCNAEYIALTEEAVYQALLTDSLSFEPDQ